MSRLQRLSKIVRVVVRYRLDTLIDTERLPGSLRILMAVGPWRLFPVPKLSPAERLRLSLEALGPIFIKFGQMLSTRQDLLSPDIISQLAKLQDQVPPFGQQQAIAIIEKSLDQPIAQLFANFDSTPLASASIAQVHCARLHSGEEVVVKVLRPGIDKTIHQDIKLLKSLAALIERFLPDGRRLRAVDVVNDYQHTIVDEMDFQREGANTSQLRRNFEKSDLLYVPEVHWDYSRHNILTMERIHGIAVTDIDALRRQNTDMKKLAENGVEIFFTQLLRDSFFHADMHPGNVFVSREHPERPQYIAIDCAIIGSLSESDQYYLARNLLAIFQRDYRLVAELHIECGWVPASTRINDFESAMRSVCEPIFEKPLGEISFGQLLLKLFQTARRFDMEVQPSLVLLQKTLLNIESLGRIVYPQLDLWATAQPFLENWLKDRYSLKGSYKRLNRHLPALLEYLPSLPDMLLQSISSGPAAQPNKDSQRLEIQTMRAEIRHLNAVQRYTKFSILLLIAAGLAAYPSWFQAIPPLSWILAAGAGLIWMRR